MLTLRNVRYTYQTKAEPVEALRGVTAAFGPGKMYAVVGSSGSGKTTLLSLLAGLDVPTAGEICWQNVKTTELDRDRFRFDHISVIYQNFNLFAHLTALENVAYPLYLRGISRREAEAVAAECLRDVGITEDKQKRLPSLLSGGEQQRVAVARAFASKAELILADEPTGNLDITNGDQVVSILLRLAHEEGRCVIIVTHDLEIAGQADQIYMMRNGEMETDA